MLTDLILLIDYKVFIIDYISSNFKYKYNFIL